MSDEQSPALAGIERGRGHRLHFHDFLHSVDPEVLERYDALARELMFRDTARDLEDRVRFLVLVGITTALARDDEGVVWSSRLAMQHGATAAQVREAVALALLPAGAPAVERAARTLRDRLPAALGGDLPEEGASTSTTP